jgi:hypothetical protein
VEAPALEAQEIMLLMEVVEVVVGGGDLRLRVP